LANLQKHLSGGYGKALRAIIVLLTILGTSDKDQCSTVERNGKSVPHWSSETSDGTGVMSEKSEGNISFQFTVE